MDSDRPLPLPLDYDITPEMAQAGADAIFESDFDLSGMPFTKEVPGTVACAVFRAMLKAAPR